MSPHVRFNCQTAKWIRAKWIRLCILAARDARVAHQTCPSEDRGRREGRVLGSHPWPVCIGRKHTVVTTGGAGSSGLPCAMVLTVSFALSSVTSSFLPPSPRGLQTHPTPGWADIVSARLDTSNGCQDHTTSPSAAAPSSARRPIAHENSPCDCLSRRRCRVHRIPRSTSVTIAIRPSCRGGTQESIMLILANREAKYFSSQGWTLICPEGV